MQRPPGLREEHLCLAWERRLYSPDRLCTGDGVPLQVVYPGRRCGDPGPDFRDAVVALPDASLWRGDVEVHLDRSGWAAHSHATNPAYRRVMLHLTWDEAAAVSTGDGRTIAGVALASCLAVPPGTLTTLAARTSAPLGPSCPSAVPADQVPALPGFLAAQGAARLTARAAMMAADAALFGYDQVIWSGLLRGLGYRRNTAPFHQLAQTVPWPTVAMVAGGRNGPADIMALLLGAAGMLDAPARPLPRADAEAQTSWTRLWLGLQPLCVGPPLRRKDWTLGGVRPDNAPARRVAAAAGLAVAYQSGLAPLLCRLVAALDRPLTITIGSDDFWGGRADFGRSIGPVPSTLLGVSRQRDLFVSAILPAVLALAGDTGDDTLAAAVWQRYGALRAAGGNQITRHMLQTIGAPPQLPTTAAVEQGLLHLYHGWCRDRRCWECPIPAAFLPPGAHAAGEIGRDRAAASSSGAGRGGIRA